MSVSVVIPLYNKIRYIRRAIDSVLAQSVQDFEVIVVDDGSTDGGGDVVRQIGDSRIRLIVQENAGPSAARNRGICEASFDLVAFLDADDEWMPRFLETVIRLSVRYPEAGIYATAFWLCDGDTRRRAGFVHCVESPEGGLIEDFFRAATWRSPVCSSNAMIPKWVFEEVGGFTVEVRQGEDLHMWTRIALRYPVAWSPAESAVYHLSAADRACDINQSGPDVAEATMIEEFLRSGREPLSSRRSVEEYLVSRRLFIAPACYLNGERAWATRLLALTQGTSQFRWRRRLLFCAFLLPPQILWPARRARALVRFIGVRHDRAGAESRKPSSATKG